MLGFLLIARLIANYFIPLNDATEARYAEIARKMLETGNWVTLLHDYTIPFWAKPPLSTWASALSMHLFGINEFAARLPSLLFSLAILFMVWKLAKKHSGLITANTAVLVLSGTLFFFLDSGTVMTDPSLLFCITFAQITFWYALVNKHKAASYLFFIALGLGLLAKGPIAIVLVTLPLFFWVVLRNQWRALWQNLPWFKGSLLTLVIALPWYILAELRTPGFLNYFIIGEHLSRFLIPGWTGDKYGMAHHAPKGMIWLFAIMGLFPWNIIAGKWLLFNAKALPSFLRDEDGWMTYWGLCMLTPLVFFTFAGNIIYPYVFPIVPAFALFFAEIWQKSHNSLKDYNRLMQAALICGFLFLIATLLFQIQPQWVAKTQKPLVQAWLNEHPAPDSALIYWADRTEYSAQFYAQGKVQATQNDKELHALFSSNPNTYLVIDSASTNKPPLNLIAECILIKTVPFKETHKTLLRCTPKKI